MIEVDEYNDWQINPNDDNLTRQTKSITAYWLNNTYDAIANITFETIFYTSFDEIPEILPFEQCMVRYENKSPKDSEFWGPIQTKQQLFKIFFTSLRCKTNPGNVYCIRKWESNIQAEYRCFYNKRLVAISADDKPQLIDVTSLSTYINKYVVSKLKFTKCVFDIGILNDNTYVFIEFNSWETNSGAYLFNWSDDTEVFYPEKDNNDITVKWLDIATNEPTQSLITFDDQIITTSNPPLSLSNSCKQINSSEINFNEIEIFDSNYSDGFNWLKTSSYIYAFNDIWLGKFDNNLKPIYWTRGIFRFSKIKLCVDGCISINSHTYYSDLRIKHTNSKIKQSHTCLNLFNYQDCGFRYGIGFKYNTNLYFASLGFDCMFTYYKMN